MSKDSLLMKLCMSLIVLITSLSFVLPQQADAVTSGGGRASSSSSSSSSASSASRTSSSSTSSMSRSQSMNQARQSQASQASKQATLNSQRQSSQNISRSQAMNQARQSTLSRQKQGQLKNANGSKMTRSQALHQAKQAENYRNMTSRTKSLMHPKGSFNTSKPYSQQYMHSTFYNDWLLYYLIMNNANHTQSLKKQKSMMKNQMNKNEKLYTITINTKDGKRIIALPKKDYDSVKKGQKIHYKNGQLKIS